MLLGWNNVSFVDAMYQTWSMFNSSGNTGESYGGVSFGFDAYRDNSIYKQNQTTVQPAAYQVLMIIKI